MCKCRFFDTAAFLYFFGSSLVLLIPAAGDRDVTLVLEDEILLEFLKVMFPASDAGSSIEQTEAQPGKLFILYVIQQALCKLWQTLCGFDRRESSEVL